MRKATAGTTASIVALGLLGSASPAYADEPPLFLPDDRTTSVLPNEMQATTATPTDGAYGRFDGAFDLGVEAGVEQQDGPSAAARVSLHYLFMAGVYASYADALGSSGLESTRTGSLGVDVRPGFIPRWAEGLQEGPEALDLALDSISLSMGTYLRQPDGHSFGDRKGFELALGFGVPLAGTATGPWIGARGILRWDDPTDRASETARAAGLMTLGWHFAVGK
jgi:hypothetical protein